MVSASNFVAVTILAGLAPFWFAERAAGLSPTEVYSRVVASTLSIKVRTHSGDRFVGAGFLVGDSGRVATAWHLVRDAEEIGGTYSDGTSAQIGGILAHHEIHDLALLQVAPTDRRPLPLKLEAPPIASRLYAIGSPRGYAFSISDGLLSQIQDIDGFPQYQLTCPFSPGNSGGPVVNDDAEVVGVSSWSKLGAQNLNFAIPSSLLVGLGSAVNSNRGSEPLCVDAGPAQRPAVHGDPSQIPASAFNPLLPGRDGLDPLLRHLHSLAGKVVHITVSADGTNHQFSCSIPGMPSVMPRVDSTPLSPSESPACPSVKTGP